MSRAASAGAACVEGGSSLRARVQRLRLRLRNRSQDRSVEGNGQSNNSVQVRQTDGVALIVFAHVAGQRRALINANNGRNGIVRENNERIECRGRSDAVDCAGWVVG